MDLVFKKISLALEIWMDNLTVLEERHQIITSLQERIQQTLIQVQQEGTMTIYTFETLHHISMSWMKLIELFSSSKDDSIKQKNN